MALIVLKVARRFNRWAVMHNDDALATFATKEEAEQSALALTKHHARNDVAELDLILNDGGHSEIRIF